MSGPSATMFVVNIYPDRGGGEGVTYRDLNAKDFYTLHLPIIGFLF